jgi:TP901-1 family phage major tail protein
MSAQRGRDMLLKIDLGEGPVTVAGLRTRRIAFNSEAADITDSESAGRWRELLAGCGIKRASIAGAGIFKDAASDLAIRSLFLGETIACWEMFIPGLAAISGPFQIVALEYSGAHDGEIAFEIALESAGELRFGEAGEAG